MIIVIVTIVYDGRWCCRWGQSGFGRENRFGIGTVEFFEDFHSTANGLQKLINSRIIINRIHQCSYQRAIINTICDSIKLKIEFNQFKKVVINWVNFWVF